MTSFDDQLERMQADGKITVHDADTVREFADFLRAAPPLSDTSPEAVSARRRALIEHADFCGISPEQVEELRAAERAYQESQ